MHNLETIIRDHQRAADASQGAGQPLSLYPFMIRGVGDAVQAFHACGWQGALHRDADTQGRAYALAELQCQKYQGRDQAGNPKIDFLVRLQALSDEAFSKQAAELVWLSAYAINNRRADYHWQADACYDEAQFRGKPELYQQAFEMARNSAA